MGAVRAVARWMGTLVGLLVLAPAVALVPAAVLDRGPRGNVRSTLFPAALALLDPFVWTCTRNSLIIAGFVALGSLLLGVGTAGLAVRCRFWGRGALTAALLAPMVVPPMLGAWGLRLTLEPSSRWSRLWQSFANAAHHDPRWAVWIWVGVAAGTPLVAMAVARALARVSPASEEAARLAGAGHLRVWWDVVWPTVRPDAARAAAAVFALTLAEPGVPLVLGLRRSLGFQLVETALRPNSAPAAAALALAAVVYASAIGWAMRIWSGAPTPSAVEGRPRRPNRLTPPAAACGVMALTLVAVLSWLPMFSLMSAALDAQPSASRTQAGHLVENITALVQDPDRHRVLINSILLGASVVALDLALAHALAAWAKLGRGAWLRTLIGGITAVPPMVLGVGAAVLPDLVRLAGGLLERAGSPAPVTATFARIADVLDPYATPLVLTVLGVAAVRASHLVEAVGASNARYRPVLVEAALSLGARPRRAKRAARAGWFGAPRSALVLTFVLAANNLTPALVITPTTESRTVLPSLLTDADLPSAALPAAATLAVLVILTNVAAFLVATRGRLTALDDRSVC